MKSCYFVLVIAGSVFGLALSCPFHLHSTNHNGTAAQQSIVNKTIDCANKLSLTLEDLNAEMFRNPEADDKCLGKCLLQQLELVSDTKLFDRDAFFELLEDQAPKALLIKLTEIVNKCADSTQIDVAQIQPKRGKIYPTLASSTTAGSASCRTYHEFLVCFNTNAEKLC